MHIKQNWRLSNVILDDVKKIIRYTDLRGLKHKSILVTGINGLFGRYFAYITYLLNKSDYDITLIGVSLHKPNKDIKFFIDNDSRITFSKKDLTKNFTFSKKIDYIFHAACYGQPQKFIKDPFSTIQLNVFSTKNLLEIARKNRARILFFSSAEIYGDIPRKMIPVSETYYGNTSTIGVRAVYSESKRLGETICSIYKRDFNLSVYIARISHVYGPGIGREDKRVLGDFIRKAIEEKKITLMDQGHAVKTFGYIADVVRMLFNIIIKGKNLIYNVGGQDTITIRQLGQFVAKSYHVPVICQRKKAKPSYIGNDPAIIRLDLTKYMKEFGKIKLTPFQDGLAKTILWDREVFQ